MQLHHVSRAVPATNRVPLSCKVNDVLLYQLSFSTLSAVAAGSRSPSLSEERCQCTRRAVSHSGVTYVTVLMVSGKTCIPGYLWRTSCTPSAQSSEECSAALKLKASGNQRSATLSFNSGMGTTGPSTGSQRSLETARPRLCKTGKFYSQMGAANGLSEQLRDSQFLFTHRERERVEVF